MILSSRISGVPGGEYMNDVQLEYFRVKLENWRSELAYSSVSLDTLDTSLNSADPSDNATMATDSSLELQTKDRYRKLLKKIDEALERIETKEYGYCAITGEEIGLARMDARPIATLSIAVQEKYERMEKLHNKE